jgi:hypothetical protein
MIHRLFIIYASDSKFKDFLGTFQPIGIYHTPSQSYKVSYYYSKDMKEDFFKSFFSLPLCMRFIYKSTSL